MDNITYHMMIPYTKGSARAVNACRGALPIYYILYVDKSPFHLATTTNTSLSLSKVHKHLPYQSVTDSLAIDF